jgi:hypothetical protein
MTRQAGNDAGRQPGTERPSPAADGGVTPCFTPGTLIATPRGEVPVELLQAGDRVVTRDNGMQDIRWIGRRHLGWPAMNAHPHLRPILIRKGSLGEGLPERDMMVSPNHRMLVSNERTALYFAEAEVLVAAKHLVGGRAVAEVEIAGVIYIHFLFDRHEVVLANGAWTESFQPSDWSLKGIGNAQRTEIQELFPELRTPGGADGFAPARRVLTRAEAVQAQAKPA